jgi:hypothetical protein
MPFSLQCYYLKSLSGVSKQFLSITNRMRCSLKFHSSTIPFLPRLLYRFTNLTSLNLSYYFYRYEELDALLCRICHFPLKLTSINLSNQYNIPTNGLRAFSKNITTLTSLTCSNITFISDSDLNLIASCFPLLEVVDLHNSPLSDNYGLSEDGIGQILRRCRNIKHLNLAYCHRLKLRQMNSVVSKLEVLNLSQTTVDDETLCVISKRCCGPFQLLLNSCCDVTEKGVKNVAENCTQLRKIILRRCYNVHPDVVASMIFSRPSLRKILIPPSYRFRNKEKELFSRHGCLVC